MAGAGAGATAAAAGSGHAGTPSQPSSPRPLPERITSQVSNLSRGEATHLRNTSDASVSSIGVGSTAGDNHQLTRSNAPSPDPVLSPLVEDGTLTMRAAMPSPPLAVSPPSTEEQHVSDYMSVVPNPHTHTSTGRNLTPAASTLAGTVAGGTSPGQQPSPSPPPPAASPLRRSYFHESTDDLGERTANDRW